MPSFIEKITVKCISQNDNSGDDDLHFYINNETEPFAKRIISSGNVVSVDSSDSRLHPFRNGIYVEEGNTITIKEYDLFDSDDLIFFHTITSSDMGSITYFDNTESAEYEITIDYV